MLPRTKAVTSNPSFRVFIGSLLRFRLEVVQMSDYEILIVMLTILAIIVGLLVEYIKK